MENTLGGRGYGIPKSALSKDELIQLKDELTVAPINHMVAEVPTFSLYLESSKKIYVPKYFGLSKYGIPEKCDIDDGEPINVPFTGLLRDEQKDPVNCFMKAANDPLQMGGILSLPCGCGKTVLGLYILSLLKRKTMIIVHKDFLLLQWKERIEEFLPSARVGMIKAKTCDVENKDIILASLQSLSMKKYESSVFNGIGFVIFDEVHRTGTEVFSKALHKTNFKYSLGLSATVKRKDGLTKVFTWFIGDIIYKIKRVKENVSVRVEEFYDSHPSYSREEYIFNNKLNVSKMLNNICGFELRNRLIANQCKILQVSTRRILILSDRKLQLDAISKYLHDMGIDNGFYIGGMKACELKISESKPVILATYAFASEGFDAKGLDTLILASPKVDIEQSVGRILRLKEADRLNVPLIIDIVDKFSIFNNQGKKRQIFYKRFGYHIDVKTYGNTLDSSEIVKPGICIL